MAIIKQTTFLVLFLSILMVNNSIFSQSKSEIIETPANKVKYQSDWELGVHLGIGNIFGDLVSKTNNASLTANAAFGLSLTKNISETFGLRASLAYTKLKSDDVDSEIQSHVQRGFSHETPLTELALVGVYELLGDRRYDDSENGKFRRTFSPYLFAGIAGAFGEPDTDYNNQTSTRISEDIEEVSGFRVAIPVGLGVKLDLTRKLVLGAEYGFRPTFNDVLDGVGASGNPDNNDWYGMGSINLTLRLGEKDTDKDGIADLNDACPQVFGLESLDGCPDRDNDGIADIKDTCPDVYGQVVLNGCPDADSDGIADADDKCPNTAGMRRFNGCPDTDGDDVVDSEDVCPNTPGLAKFGGCPDTDGDGIVDAEDKCPALAGTGNGCPDTDGDGIIDPEDKCPNTAGISAFGGCPDTDGDGIADADDKCPTIAGPGDGCPTVKEEDLKVLDFAMKNVRFKTNSAELTSESMGILNQIAEVVGRYPDFKLSMSGYTDDIGNDFSNQQLSERRAKACLDYLATKGIATSRMSSTGYGENNPIATNQTPEGRRQNRRVEFKLERN